MSNFSNPSRGLCLSLHLCCAAKSPYHGVICRQCVLHPACKGLMKRLRLEKAKDITKL
jgi:hypothetical protein